MMNSLRLTTFVLAFFPLFATAQPVWLNDSLVFFEDFDEAYEPFGISESYAAHAGNAAHLQNQRVTVEIAELGLNSLNMTLSFWVKAGPKISAYNSPFLLSSKPAPNCGGFGTEIGGAPDKFGFKYGIGCGAATGLDVAEDFTIWRHICTTYDSQRGFMVYVDGVMIGQRNQATAPDETINYMHIGGDRESNKFNGFLDNLRLFNRPLSAAEIAQLYDYESQPQASSNTRKASAMAQVVNGFIVGAEVADGGYGYSSNPEVTISGGGGSGAVATATVSAGKVVKINIINPGFGYTGDPTIDIAAPPVPPAPAYATAEVINGFVVGTTLVTGGEGYTEPPVVKVTGGNGQGATMSAEVADGRVVAVNVINPGSGYTTAPVITIAPPPTAPELSIRVTQVEVNMKLTEGKRYTIESSKNMVDWTQTGPLFVAEEQFMAVKFDVDEFGQFFRVIEQP